MNAVTRSLIRYRAWIIAVSAVLGVIGFVLSIRLYRNLKPDLEELLPRSARSIQDLDEVRSRLRSIDNIAILIFSQDPAASRRFVDDLASRLKQGPRDLIGSVEYRIERELEFFEKRRALYIELPDLERVRDYIEDRLSYERTIRNPLNIFSGIVIPEPKFNFGALRAKYEARTRSYTHFPGGYYATPDQLKRVVLVYKVGTSASAHDLARFKSFIVQTIASLNPRSYAPDIEIHYSGNIEDRLEEQADVFSDVASSTLLVAIFVTLVLLLFFRSVRLTGALLISLAMGTFWTFGLAWWIVGSLNSNSAFLGSIIVGNGINVGIILTARYLEERRNGLTREDALGIAVPASASATLMAALAAALAYGSLMLTGFRGFRQFGLIGLSGMVLCWVSAYTALPALIYAIDRKGVREPAKPARFGLISAIALLPARWPKGVAVVTALLTIGSIALLSRVGPEQMETDMTKLRSRVSMSRGSGYYSRFVDEIFQRYLTPVVILPRDRAETREIAARLRALKARQGPSSLIASVQTIDDFIPDHQREKIAVINRIRDDLPPSIVRRLSARERALIHEFLTPEARHPIGMEDLPPLILNRFTEKDGSVGKLVLVEPPLGNEIKQRGPLFRFVGELRQVADSVHPGTAVAGTLPVTADLFSSVLRDGPRATFVAFCAVVLLTLALFRNFRASAAVLSSLCLGVLWLVGILLAFGIKINFLNFIALPITFGIGVDYSVNMMQRYRQEGPGSILKVVRHTGAAVGLCSMTTIIGYSSLLTAKNRAFFSFGLVAVLGELCCISAALIAMPTIFHLRDLARKGAQGDRGAKAA